MYNENRIGPKTEPWGRPYNYLLALDKQNQSGCTEATEVRLEPVWNHTFYIKPGTQTFDQHTMMVLNTADWSKETTAVASPLARARSIQIDT